MHSRRYIAILCVLAAFAVPGTLGGAASGADRRDGRDGSRPSPSWAAGVVRPGGREGIFTGIDGILHDNAPDVVDGLDGEMFFGVDFDVACAFGKEYARSMRAMTKLAKVIDRSGRTVVWTVSPSKTSVLPASLDLANLPHGRCAKRGLRLQTKVLDTHTDPWFLPLRRRLADDPRQVYWKTDPHWTTVGGAVFAKELAKRLDPALGRRQQFRLGSETQLGLFDIWRGDDTPETWQSAYPDTSVSVRTTAGSAEAYTAFPDIVFDHSWKSRPARKTWPGRTLIVGDSMGVVTLENLRPIFRRGRYIWVAHVDDAELVAAIVKADTVVLEKFQTFMPFQVGLGSVSLRRAVADALRRDTDHG